MLWKVRPKRVLVLRFRLPTYFVATKMLRETENVKATLVYVFETNFFESDAHAKNSKLQVLCQWFPKWGWIIPRGNMRFFGS